MQEKNKIYFSKTCDLLVAPRLKIKIGKYKHWLKYRFNLTSHTDLHLKKPPPKGAAFFIAQNSVFCPGTEFRGTTVPRSHPQKSPRFPRQ